MTTKRKRKALKALQILKHSSQEDSEADGKINYP